MVSVTTNTQLGDAVLNEENPTVTTTDSSELLQCPPPPPSSTPLDSSNNTDAITISAPTVIPNAADSHRRAMAELQTDQEVHQFEQLKQRILLESPSLPEEKRLTPALRTFLDDMQFVRYLRARDWDIDKAEEMLRTTLEWRRHYKPEEIKFEEVKEVAEYGALWVNGHDREGCPVIVMKTGAYNPFTPEQRLRYLVFVMEQTFYGNEHARQHHEKAVWLLDFAEFGKGRRSAGSRQVHKETQNVLQNHYPERLKRALLMEPPWYFFFAYMLISPFLTARTKAKIEMVRGTEEQRVETLHKYVADDMLEELFGGSKPHTNETLPESARASYRPRSRVDKNRKPDQDNEVHPQSS